MNRRGISSIVIILIIVGVLVIGGGIYWWQTKPNIPIIGGDTDEHGCKGSAGYSWCAEKNKCLRIWEEACTSPKNETADWKTYGNEKYGFEVKYPDKIELKETIDKGVKTIAVKEFDNLVSPYVFSAGIETSNIPGLFLVGFLVRPKPSNFVDLATYLEREKISCQEAMSSSAAGGICSVTEVSLGSQKLPALVTLETSARANTDVGIPVERGDKILEIRYSYARYGNNSDDENIYNITQKILSTFKFTK